MKIESTQKYGYLVLSGWELERWNLKFLVHHDRKVVTFCATDFFVKKIVKYDNMFIVLAVLQSAWNMKELKREIRRRAPHLDMNDDDFFRVHKSYKAELTRIENQSYYVGETPENYIPSEILEELELLTVKLVKGRRFQKHHPKAKNSLKKQFGDLDELEAYIQRVKRSYNTPEEEDLWSNHKTTIDDYDLYDIDYDLY